MSATAPRQTVFSIGYDFHAGNGTPNSGADNGNVYGITNYKDQNRDQTFTYDLLNRLVTAQNAGTDCTAKVLQNKTEYWGNSYGYDAWGNLLQKTITKCGAENLSVTADGHNWLHASGTDYQYDAAGNMTYDATASLSYTFDQENRLTGAGDYTYTYDGDGNRVRKSNGNLAASGTLYWYMTPGVVAETDLAGTLKSEYIFLGGERVARKDFPGDTVAYYFSDHLSTASAITDSAGTIKEEFDYYPWGGELQFVANDSNQYKYGGHERDSEDSLDYFGARYYSNALGRFIVSDWASKPAAVPYSDFGNPQSLNLYSYTKNNPTTFGDLDGHCPDSLCIALGIIDGIFRDGGVKPYSKNVGIGSAKGTGMFVYKTAALMEAAGSGNPAKSVTSVLDPGPEKLQPSNQTQAQASIVTQATLGVVAGAIPTGPAVTTEATLTRLANEAVENIGPGSGAVYGTTVHSEFTDLVEGLENPSLFTEQSYLNGKPVDYGTPGSVRVDVGEGTMENPTAVYDLKTGSAKLTPARIQQIQKHVPKLSNGNSVPVKEIKPK
jgi:RHS repeat-associated protein